MDREERPKFVTDEHLEFPDDLRASGATNMYGATPYIQREYPELSQDEAIKVLTYWMHTFGERNKPF